MTDYRVYKLDSSGKTTGPPLIVYCEDDDAALIIAKRTMAGRGSHHRDLERRQAHYHDPVRPRRGTSAFRRGADAVQDRQPLLLVTQSRHLIGQRIESVRP
jgi:hypothetical protein